jgi:hypothetical protein
VPFVYEHYQPTQPTSHEEFKIPTTRQSRAEAFHHDEARFLDDEMESEAHLNASAYYSDYVSAAQRKDSSISIVAKNISADQIGEIESLDLE